ncbi:hypothetical protein ACFST9_01265 [Hymenobacter monticola]|uniref:Uncharacterized protein n=1 Tax=Hymenobacter monticola TaxID=1705399 RepID=A0ABY4B529_9BACT|nr:hypothetical protein [Hymenobacter monticola]UOE33407.1 hypothetical protein MTP16_20065 [Hymenobacter monticola]
MYPEAPLRFFEQFQYGPKRSFGVHVLALPCCQTNFISCFAMKKSLLLLLASLLLVLTSPAPANAQMFHRLGHANRSRTKKAEHSNKHVKHRDKKKVKKKKPENDKSRRRKEAKLQKERREDGGRIPAEATEPEKSDSDKSESDKKEE